LGTAAYMSPEQAKGRESDRTSDIWGFGCVLYEMLTGRVVFERETIGEILAAVFRDEPDWEHLPSTTPDSIRRLLRRCLKKEQARRLHDMADAILEIDDALNEPVSPGIAVPTESQSRERTVWISALVILFVIATWALLMERKPAAPQQMRLDIAASTDVFA